MAKIILFGKNGQIGSALTELMPDIVAYSSKDIDITDSHALTTLLEKEQPTTIINAAAYTAVDAAEVNVDEACAVNSEAPKVIAREAARLGSLLVHYSSDYVFDGTKDSPYVETDRANPLNMYGKTKLEGDHAVLESGCRHLIIRTSWVYSPQGKNFLNTVLAKAKAQQETMSIVSDQCGSPTSSLGLAIATAEMLHDISAIGLRGRSGIYNVVAQGFTNWYEFARTILEKAKYTLPVLTPITGNEWAGVPRPQNSQLDCTKLQKQFGITMDDWQWQLDQVLKVRLAV